MKKNKHQEVAKKNLVQPFKKGSILAYSLVIITMMLAIAGSITVSTILENKSAGSTDASAQALQAADSGMQIALKKWSNSPNTADLSAVFGPNTNGCVNGATSTDPATVTADNIGGSGASYTLSFEGSTGVINTCNTLANQVVRIKSVGYYLNTVRAISVGIDSPCTASTTCGNACAYNGDSYKTVQIGSGGSARCWMKDNLITTKDADGNAVASLCSTENGACDRPWGKMYTWAAAMNLASSYNTTLYAGTNIRGICPKGWHIPTSNDLTLLSGVVSGNSNGLKDLLTWNSFSGVTPTNATGFSGIAAGTYTTIFTNRRSVGYIWASQQIDAANAMVGRMVYDSTTFDTPTYTKAFGMSVRCVKD